MRLIFPRLLMEKSLGTMPLTLNFGHRVKFRVRGLPDSAPSFYVKSIALEFSDSLTAEKNFFANH